MWRNTREVRWSRSNGTRGTALETAYGCGERKKALKGEPHERIRSEIMAGRHGADPRRHEVERT
jgi:hypothetical protein